MYLRTVDETKTVISHAKLDESDLQPITQVLHFSSRTEATESFKFMEVDSNILNDLQEGESLIFRGAKDEHAVLCTDTCTYEVKEAETSNSMLLLSGLLWAKDTDCETEDRVLEEKEVMGVFYKYYELRPCNPRLHKLRQILDASQFHGPEHEDNLIRSGVKLYTLQELLDTVQASKQELHLALHEELACCIGGRWRRLEHDYHFRVLSYILNLVEENSWSVNSVSKKDTKEALQELVPEEVLEQCFGWYTEPVGKTDSEGNPLYKLLEDKVCRFLAEVLLRPAGKFNLQEFLQAWQQSVPEGMKTTVTYLEGIALMDRDSKPEVIWYFPETNLPEEITARLRVLFQTKEKWTFNDIRPYVQRLATDKMNVNALLTKYARASTLGGVKCYSAKHAK